MTDRSNRQKGTHGQATGSLKLSPLICWTQRMCQPGGTPSYANGSQSHALAEVRLSWSR